ncbi:glycerol-3-phosphate 1-O-acyltransferase [Rhodococcus sp. HNM0569]|uniref:glycerol-3-phosphate 1-O-acyltransferase n=1 Tax=Rhodococcus sp. HNM0569 TaxID=2716340 RepID=UPI00146F8C90|nr:glycerol-3-phosphate 1-O-acyltransferase [Rhodococcus sp. HNM0569]NLU82643.1 glycerol-3-phosphate 1-O-acyltransferase [Rhodococcus sp. HNM0569]
MVEQSGTDAARPRLYLTEPMTPVERDVLDAWLRERATHSGGRDGVVVTTDELDAVTRRTDDPVLAPVRVVWLPTDDEALRRDGRRVRDLVRVDAPLRLARPRQRRALRSDPSRAHVLEGAAAPLSDLARRRDEHGSGSLPEFVRRQAALALERAERSLLGGEYKVSRFVVDEITGSRRFDDGVRELAARLDLDAAEVASRARAALDEMVATQSRRASAVWGRLGRYFSRAYRLHVDTTRLDEIVELDRAHSLVFLPSHRSYLDPLVLRPALTSIGLPLNHVMGGLNVSFWPIGPISKRSGTVFIRRTMGDDDVYKWSLAEYMRFLTAKRFNLEWYLEGGRSRTGKLRPPRFGLLTYLAKAVAAQDSEHEVYLVPVSITYDQLHEVGAMADEAHGAAKTREGIRWLVGYVRAQGNRHGVAHVSVGRPLAFREFLAREPDDLRLGVQKAAFEVSHRINEVTPVTASSLVMLAFLGIEDRALTARELEATLGPLVDYITARRLPTAGSVDVADRAVVRAAVETHLASGVLRCFDRAGEPVYFLAPGQHLVAAFYRNNTVHFFVIRAIAEMVVEAAVEGRHEDPFAAGWAEALRLRDLLKFEFFFGDKASFALELRAELDLIDPTWESNMGDATHAMGVLDRITPYLAHRVLQPYLEAYAVVADLLCDTPPGDEIDEKQFVRSCLDVAERRRLRQEIGSRESISIELFSTALQLARNRDLVAPGGADLADRRRAFADELHTHVRRVLQIREIAHRRLDLIESPAP